MLKELAQRVKEEGGRAMLVGGYVRDELLKQPSKDIDVEIYGIQPEKLRAILEEFGKVDCVGESFQVYKLGDMDISLPRRDRKVGAGHKGFIVEGDPFMSFEEACSRRDFTINAIMKDPLTDEIIDPFYGVYDLTNKEIKAVSKNSFTEDPLRVLRMLQFASRFNFKVDTDTCGMAKEVNLSELPKERIWTEIEKALMKSEKPSIFFTYSLISETAPQLFPELDLFASKELKALDSNFITEGVSYAEELTLKLACLLHKGDFSLLDRLGVIKVQGYPVRKAVEALVKVYNRYPVHNELTDFGIKLLAREVNLRLFGKMIRAFKQKGALKFIKRVEELGVTESPIKPILTGDDLLELGYKPSKEFGKILEEVYLFQLSDLILTKEEAKRYLIADEKFQYEFTLRYLLSSKEDYNRYAKQLI